MKMQTVLTDKAPSPIGPYSQAVKAGNLLFLSGQIAIDATTGQMVQESIALETEKVMENISALLDASGASFSGVVKTTIFLSDMAHFPMVNEVYGKYFQEGFPARETVAVAGLPKNANVEISLVALLLDPEKK